MTTASSYISQADRLLDKNGHSEVPTPRLQQADVTARIATATALDALAEAARADGKRPTLTAPTEWPAGVTARILTRVGILLCDARATVDIHDDDPHSHSPQSKAVCRACGQTREDGLSYRNHKVAPWAQEHADQCTALPNPTT